MPYPTLPGRRFEYDVGGGSVYYGNDINGITTALTTEQMAQLNGIGNTSIVISKEAYDTEAVRTVWVFLPEKFVIAGLGMIHRVYTTGGASGSIAVAGSADSTNGLDGTWISATLPNGAIPAKMIDDDVWRDSIQPCTFSEAIKVLRLRYYAPFDGADYSRIYIYALHIYGVKASGEVPDDILFLDDDASGDPEFIRDLDFGDRPEGTTVTHRIKLRNSSTTKIANNLTLTLIDVDLTFSMDEGATWVTGATITSLAPQGTSNSILIKNTIPPPTQMLGPRAPRFEVTIGSWS
ncbi:MAG: hypothetical protein CVV04_00105 [Firmicutes bacterium HGW-Firmicutes-9]|jgi:hypothetical protein|nr:MAG: hypothetical protein CVV04_00105 [Firmicutes bacterium HGW-Firmicutes-9]